MGHVPGDEWLGWRRARRYVSRGTRATRVRPCAQPRPTASAWNRPERRDAGHLLLHGSETESRCHRPLPAGDLDAVVSAGEYGRAVVCAHRVAADAKQRCYSLECRPAAQPERFYAARPAANGARRPLELPPQWGCRLCQDDGLYKQNRAERV